MSCPSVRASAINVGGVLGQIVGGWTLTGIHNYRSGGTLSVSDAAINGAGYPIRPDLVAGVDPIIYDGSAVDLARGTPYLNPAAFATQPLTAQGIPTRIGTAPAILDVRGPARYTEDLGFLKRVGGQRAQRRGQSRRPQPAQSLRPGRARTPIWRARTSAGSSALAQGARRLQLSLRATF